MWFKKGDLDAQAAQAAAEERAKTGKEVATDKADSPHRIAPKIRCESYFACAEIDKWAPPADIGAHAHLQLIARDAAGNLSTTVTPDAVLLDDPVRKGCHLKYK